MTEDQAPESKITRLNGNLYDIVFPGGRKRGALPLRLLGYTSYEQVGRFRDGWIERSPSGQLAIHIYTRNGGANRADYARAIEQMQHHEWFDRDADDTFDSTYASFWFNIRPGSVAGLDPYAVDPVDTDARWAEAIRALNTREVPADMMSRAKQTFGPALDTLADFLTNND